MVDRIERGAPCLDMDYFNRYVRMFTLFSDTLNMYYGIRGNSVSERM